MSHSLALNKCLQKHCKQLSVLSPKTLKAVDIRSHMDSRYWNLNPSLSSLSSRPCWGGWGEGGGSGWAARPPTRAGGAGEGPARGPCKSRGPWAALSGTLVLLDQLVTEAQGVDHVWHYRVRLASCVGHWQQPMGFEIENDQWCWRSRMANGIWGQGEENGMNWECTHYNSTSSTSILKMLLLCSVIFCCFLSLLSLFSISCLRELPCSHDIWRVHL